MLPGPLGDILASKSKLQQFDRLDGVCGWQAMEVGSFEAWDKFEVDMVQVPLLVDQMDKIRGKLNSFTIKVSDVIEWEDLVGIDGIGTGNLKKVKINWTCLAALKFLIIWSCMVAGVSMSMLMILKKRKS